MRTALVGLAALVAAAGWSGRANAGACCGEVSTFGDRLTTGESLAASAGAFVRPRFGSFDRDGRHHGVADGASDVSVGLVGDTIARVTDRFEIGASVEALLNARSSNAVEAVGGGVGDVRARGRVTIVDAGATRYWPGVSTVVGVVVPTGVPSSRSTADLAVDVTGQGSGEVLLGASLDKLWDEVVFARLEGSVGLFAPESVRAAPVVRAPRLTVSAVVGPNFFWGSLGVGVTHEAEGPPLTSPQRGAEPSRTRTELGLFSAFPFGRRFSLLAQVRAPLPVDGFGSQEDAAVSASVAARMAVLD